MAVTTKTLTPTNQTVTLPDMTERPDASVLVTDISREVDAINALNSTISNKIKLLGNTPASKDYTIDGSSRLIMFAIGTNDQRAAVVSVFSNASGAISIAEIGGNNHTAISFSSSANNKITVTNSSGSGIPLYALVFEGGIS